MLDRTAWAAPASDEDVAQAVATVVALIEPDAAPERVGVLARFIGDQGYTAAEMRLIEREGPKANHYGKHVRIDVLNSIVEESRKMRAMLDRVLTGEDVSALCTAHPEVRPEDFACASFDRFNNPLWRYAPDVARRARERGVTATPELPETAGRDDRPAPLGIIGGGAPDQ